MAETITNRNNRAGIRMVINTTVESEFAGPIDCASAKKYDSLCIYLGFNVAFNTLYRSYHNR